MSEAVAQSRGTAEMQGDLWSARAATWAQQESRQAPVYEAVLDALGIGPGTTVLDVGCGSGVGLRLAADRGARVSGLDASEALLDIARARVPEADLRAGDLQFLPFDDDTFDVVTGFNAFQFAADMTAALREARRVTEPGGRVVVQVWGRAERCDLVPVMRAVAPLLPIALPSGPGGRAFSDTGVLEELAEAAGLTPLVTSDVVCPFDYADEETCVATMRSAGLIELAARTAGEEAVRSAIAGAIAPYREPDGGFRLVNEWHWLVALA
jgi:SAM-dependent methyltransferase